MHDLSLDLISPDTFSESFDNISIDFSFNDGIEGIEFFPTVPASNATLLGPSNTQIGPISEPSCTAYPSLLAELYSEDILPFIM